MPNEGTLIPANLQEPGFYARFANNQASADNLYTLLIGQTITAAPATPTWVGGISQAIKSFGANSQLTAMIERYLSTDPSSGLLYVLPLADAGSSVAAAGSVAFSGPATEAGTINLYIAGRQVQVPVTAAETAADIATAAAAKINAYVDASGVTLPVTAAVDGTTASKVDLTADNKGTLGNAIDVRVDYYGARGEEYLPAGVTVTITALSGGATDPDLTDLAAMIGDEPYEFIACPWATTAALNDVKSVLDERWSYTKQLYGHAYAPKVDADTTGATNEAFVAARNNKHECVISVEPSPMAPWEMIGAAVGLVASSSRLDPARPFQTLVLTDLLAPPAGSRYGFDVRNALLQAGAGLVKYNADGTVKIDRLCTSYKTNSDGAVDTTWHDSETAHLISRVVRQQKYDFQSAFPRAKLVDDGTDFGAGVTFTTDGAPDQPLVTPKLAKSTLMASAQPMVTNGWLNGLPSYTVLRSTTDATRLDIAATYYLAAGLRIVAVTVQFSLGTRS